ncbi:NAD(P)H-dependent oxidoreductase subunit E [Eubacteriales bacterium OttesenSCG-928-N14]|nr:NAD(P)H-dependent oxidoreductase subunit E [Eubacteriales bacterium OttesenSCG-928-N14]
MSVNQNTQHLYDELAQYIEENKNLPGALMPVMQKAQDLFGYLGEPIQVFISDHLGVPVSQIYGVATFYAQFALEPKGEYVISVCMGTACYVRGSQAVMDKLVEEIGVEAGKTSDDGKFTIEAARCIGCCGLAPVITVGGDVYGRLVDSDVPGIIEKYRS